MLPRKEFSMKDNDGVLALLQDIKDILYGIALLLAGGLLCMAGILLGGLGLVLTIVMFTISGSFAEMEVTDMGWKAVSCLVWEAALALIATLAINLTAAVRFDRKGEYRKKTKE